MLCGKPGALPQTGGEEVWTAGPSLECDGHCRHARPLLPLAQHGFTAVLVTHDVEEAVLLCDRVLVLESGRIRRSVEVDLRRPRARHLPVVARLSLTLLSAIMGNSLAEQALRGRAAEVCHAPLAGGTRRRAASNYRMICLIS